MRPSQFIPDRVLITRLSAIGDCLLTVPLAESVKHLWPHCEITWAVQCGASTLLAEHPAVGCILKVDKHWMTKPSAWLRLRKELRARRFDLVLDPQGLTKSALLGWLSGARLRIGFDRSHGRELAPWIAHRRVRKTARHMVDVYRELLSPWERFSPGTATFHMPIYTAAAQIAQEILRGLRITGPWVCMNVGAGWPSKVWPADRYALVARRLHQHLGITSLVVWSGEEEHRMATQVVRSSPLACVLAPDTSLQVLAELLRRSEMYIGSDTGPMHLAAAVGTLCVSMFGPTWSDECGPYGSGHVAIQSPLLPTRNESMRRTDNAAMLAITVDEVVDACLNVLRQSHNRAVA